MFTKLCKSIKYGVLAVVILVSSSLAGGPQSQFPQGVSTTYVPHEILIRYTNRSDMNNSGILGQIQSLIGGSGFVQKIYKNLPITWIHSENYTVSQLISKFRQLPGVEAVAPNYIRHIQGATNDTYYNDLWAIENNGQNNGTVDADIDGKEAWDIERGSHDVVVAVLDTGIDYNHPDLADNMWDGSAYNIPHHGWDFAGDSNGNNDDDPNPGNDDDLKHGTHVAGTIGAVSNNNRGTAGVSQLVSLMAVKVFRPNGYAYDSDILEGVDFVADLADQGVNIVAINASYGGGGASNVMKDAIEDLGNKGVVFCAAAGNEDNDNDTEASYPASYDLDNIIAVAATDRNDELASFSNYGETSVDVAAPGVAIMSTIPGNDYASWNGTSMATPHVAGLVALLAAYNPNSTVAERIQAISSSVDHIDSLEGKVATSGRINAKAALEAIGGDGNQNHAPRANAGGDQQVDQGTEVTLDGSSSSDRDGDILTYQWHMVSKPDGSDAVLVQENTVHPLFTADMSGDYIVELVVNDGEINSTADRVVITAIGDITTWSTGAYGNNEDRRQELKISGATQLSIHIEGETESRYDYIYIYDAEGNQIAKFDGKIDETLTVDGSSITARLTSDGSVTKDGVTITITEVNDNGGGNDENITTWSTGAYGNNEDRRQELKISGATQLSIHIEGETESRYDYIYIYDAEGNQIAKLDGKIDETLTVDGSSITARLTSDGSVTKDGVTVTIRSL